MLAQAVHQNVLVKDNTRWRSGLVTQTLQLKPSWNKDRLGTPDSSIPTKDSRKQTIGGEEINSHSVGLQILWLASSTSQNHDQSHPE